ncbi:HCL470Cp [Eremothecium sinecaudum]|uniref:HCL470Cp n=1 Tax=Eremothecium sinecaudum TaxID=45286 RepID=A0A120K1T6_9SACH|nr:HCL470Cp [Eremothecium sinecaudum]AMD19681.1 HCL470Cp [Eremothecium sinecaudum]
MNAHKNDGAVSDETTEDEDNSLLYDAPTVSPSATATTGVGGVSTSELSHYRLKICKELGLIGVTEGQTRQGNQGEEELANEIDDGILRNYIELQLTTDRIKLESLKRDNLNKIDEILSKLIRSNIPISTFDRLLQASRSNNAVESTLPSTNFGLDNAFVPGGEQVNDNKRKRTEPKHLSRHRRHNSELHMPQHHENAHPTVILPQLQQRWTGNSQDNVSPTATPRYPLPVTSPRYTFPTNVQSPSGPSPRNIIHSAHSEASAPSHRVTIGPSPQLANPLTQLLHAATPLTGVFAKQQSHNAQPQPQHGDMFSNTQDGMFLPPNTLPLKAPANITSSSSITGFNRGHRRTQSAQVRVVPEMSTFTVNKSPAIAERRVEDISSPDQNHRFPQSNALKRSPTTSGASTSSKVSFLIHTPKHPPKR